MKKVLIFAVLWVVGCKGIIPEMMNSVDTTKSEFDGSTEIVLHGGWVEDAFRLGAMWRSPDPETVLFKATLPRHTVNLSAEDGLQFNIDGDIINLDSPDVLTSFESEVINGVLFKESYRYYVGSRELVDILLGAESVKAKLVTGDGYIVGDFSEDGISRAIRGFRDFQAALPVN